MKKKLLVALGLSGIIAASVAVGAYAASDIKLFINGKLINADLQIVDGNSYVPLRVVSESLGADVKWDGEKREISIQQKGVSETKPSTSADAVSDTPDKLAIEFINTFFNERDKTKMESFLKEKIHNDTQPIYQMLASYDLKEPHVLLDPEIIETTKFEDKGTQVDLLLINAKNDSEQKKEVIAMTKEGKFFILLMSDATSENDKKAYSELRVKFSSK
ncbi:stalk domain-containing protein [Paenibacillus sp. GCM10023248]|uniref:copper amine oxidase N-terminal domain-containing protein n=1 Tax=unclassified Paenibacillus TaxID=185978 RepID=UPI002378ADDE|nr:copper amine oxidase N-terminal domain-containing protein [Paenibacillus sp. MAHUQ-63]MDD9266033.1 copper amine oxidase N-terminal domain-containing protein [Paenibacillus sp. MAHUQ-63]